MRLVSQETCTHVDLTCNLHAADFSSPSSHTPSHLLIALLLPPSQLAIGDMLIALRESRAPLYSSSSSSSPPPPQPRPPRRVRVAAEDNHYHICRTRLRTSRRLFGLSASRVGTKCKAAARLVGGQREVGRREGNRGIDRLCLFIDVYLLAFTRLITL